MAKADSVPVPATCDTSVFRITYGGSANYQLLYLQSLPGDDVISAGQTNARTTSDFDGWVLKANKFGQVLWSKAYGSSQN
ncbi:MAG TPA: hypothetical protein VHA52_09585, partial [Candidatus Babeliaceae bacterium]|nr:hypothetical protein [Candidatus Babeliaceae bacterium]